MKYEVEIFYDGEWRSPGLWNCRGMHDDKQEAELVAKLIIVVVGGFARIWQIPDRCDHNDRSKQTSSFVFIE